MILILFIFSVFAEYRVFQYYVKKHPPSQKDPYAYLTLSTLDPVSFVSYHGGSTFVKVELMRTWMCPGYTGHNYFCKSPYEKSLEEVKGEKIEGIK